MTIGLFSGTIGLSISSQMTQCRIILLLQPITKLYLFTIELKLRDDFRYFRSKMWLTYGALCTVVGCAHTHTPTDVCADVCMCYYYSNNLLRMWARPIHKERTDWSFTQAKWNWIVSFIFEDVRQIITSQLKIATWLVESASRVSEYFPGSNILSPGCNMWF